MKILLDMNISPLWINFFTNNDHFVYHWSQVGSPNDPDIRIMKYARENGFVILTHDLDFGDLLSKHSYKLPSIVLIRQQNVIPLTHGELLLRIIASNEGRFANGVLITISRNNIRIRDLPIPLASSPS